MPQQILVGPNAVWKQPIAQFGALQSQGVTILDNWEEQLDANNQPTISLQTYLDKAHTAGLKVIVQLNATQPIPWKHPAIAATSQDDEPDNIWVSGDTGITARLQTQYAMSKANRPDLPVYLNIDGWQWQWQKPPYTTFFACCDFLIDDYYFDLRALDIADWSARQSAIQTQAAGKLVATYVATSYQNEPAIYYPNQRTPTVASVQQQFDAAAALQLATPIFPQSFNPFAYTSQPADISALIAEANAPPLEFWSGILTVKQGKITNIKQD